MRRKSFSIIILLLAAIMTHAQTHRLIVNPSILLPEDSLEGKQLIAGLNAFLMAAQGPNEENELVLPAEKIETYILLDEINGIEKSGKFKDDFFYKPYLTNLVPLDKNKYSVQVSYIGVDGSAPILRASFQIIANKANNAFLFSSPLLRNTKSWKISTVGSSIFHYQSTINEANIQEYGRLATTFDKKLKLVNKITEFYCCENFVDLLRLIGVEYKSDYNGIANNSLISLVGDRMLVTLSNNASFDNFDPHDLWHDRLSLAISRGLVNKPIDEGCAYLYGGSWGISWKDIFKQFKAKVAHDKNADWAGYKENQVNFGESEAEHLYVDYVVNALIIQKIEKEKGFEGVWTFLTCGKYEKGNENYYKALEHLTGITKASYNKAVWELINKEI